MLTDKTQRTKISLCGINPSVGRRIAEGEFQELFSELEYNEKADRFVISLKVNADELGDKERKKLKDKIFIFENKKQWKNVFKVEVLNKVDL